jgi:hypothetical protein
LGQEFTIKSAKIEEKINQLLPTQGGFGAGVDFSASTMVIPIVDLTETAEGSQLRSDLQTSLSLNSITAFSVVNTTSTIINTTGYFRIFGTAAGTRTGAGFESAIFSITDGTTTKVVLEIMFFDPQSNIPFDFVVFLQAGDSVTLQSNATTVTCKGVTRQIADLSGNLVSPT